MTLQEVRQKYPQYNKLSDQVLADSLYKKYYEGKLKKTEFYAQIEYTPKPVKKPIIGKQNVYYDPVTGTTTPIPSKQPSFMTKISEGIRNILPFYMPPSGPPVYNESGKFQGFLTPLGEVEKPPTPEAQTKWLLFETLFPAAPTIGKSFGLAAAKSAARKEVTKGIKKAVPSAVEQFKGFRMYSVSDVTEAGIKRAPKSLVEQMVKLKIHPPSVLAEERHFKPMIERSKKSLDNLTKLWEERYPHLTDVWKERPRTGKPRPGKAPIPVQTTEGIKGVVTESRAFSDVITEINKLRWGGSLGAKKYTTEYAGSINLHNLDLSETAERILKDYGGGKQPKISWEETKRVARENGWDLGSLKKLWQKNKILTRPQVYALREIMTDTVQQIGDTVDALPYNLTKEQAADVGGMLLNYKHNVLEFAQKPISETGRLLNSMKINITPTQRIDAILKHMPEDSIGEFVKLWKETDFNAIGLNVSNLNRMIKRVTAKRTTADLVHTFFINALLSGGKTHVRNLVGNTITLLGKIPEKGFAAAIDTLRVTGKRALGQETERERYFRELMPEVYGMIGGLEQNLHKALSWASRAKVAFNPKYRLPAFAEMSKIEDVLRQRGKWEIPTHLLDLEDRFFKIIVYGSEIQAGAIRRGLKKGLRGKELRGFMDELISSPTEDLIREAGESALFRTFQNPMGEWGKWFARGREFKVLGVKPLAYIVPFLRTIINIGKYGLKHTPANFAYISLKHKEMLPAQMVDELARATMGSLVMQYLVKKAGEGKIIGSGPRDPKERKLWRDAGHKPNTFWTGKDEKGNDTYRSFMSIEPPSILMNISADYVYLRDHMSEWEAEKFASYMMASIANNFINKQYLSGLAAASKALAFPEVYAEKWYAQLAGGFVPSIIRDIAYYKDPNIRQAKNLLDRIQNRLPGRQKLPVELNFFGEEQKYLGHPATFFFNPFYLSVVPNDAVMKEMYNLEVTKSMPTRIGLLELDPWQRNKLIKLINTIKLPKTKGKAEKVLRLKDILRMHTSSKGWFDLPSFTRKNIFEDQIVRFTKLGIMSFLATLTPEQQRLAKTAKKLVEPMKYMGLDVE